jgi:hypothetical protein
MSIKVTEHIAEALERADLAQRAVKPQPIQK